MAYVIVPGHKINVGRRHSRETREKLRLSKLGDKNPAKRVDVREKMRLSHLGKPSHRKGKTMPPVSVETREKLSRAQKARYDRVGRKSYPSYVRINKAKEYVLWRTTIFERDDYTCQAPQCRKRGGKLEAHHIKKWADFPELRFVVENGVSLCKDCHKKTNNYGNRK